MGVLRGDHGCRLLPPVPTVTIESHGCPGDAGRGLRDDVSTAGGGGGASVCGASAHRNPWGPGTGVPEGGACTASAPRTAARGGAEGLGVCGPGAGPGVGGRDWRLLLRAARAVSSLEPRCRRAARAGISRRPQLRVLLLLRAPPSAQARADRHATVTSESCDVKDVPAGRHFRRWGAK